MRRLALALVATGALAAAGCEDRWYREVGAEIRVLTERRDSLVTPAIQRLAKFQRRALPQIEIALHTASSAGKVNLVRALDAIADPESTAILRHFALYDAAPEVRTACGELLASWARRPPPLGEAAKAALARIAQQRAAGEGPVVVGEPTAK